MAWPSRVRCNFQLLLLAAALLLVGLAEVKAAYRLTFQNGTSLEVQGYEDLGDSIRYPRFGGAVTVPKANVTAIQELPPAPASGLLQSLRVGRLDAPMLALAEPG